MPNVSVGLPCYNGSRWLAESIESVLHQTYPDFELVIVDDGSTDNSKKIIERYLEDVRVRYLYQENKGFSGATNRCIADSRGDYIAFMGQDDLWLPDKLERQVHKIEKGKYSLIHSDVYDIDSEGRIIGRRNLKVPKTQDREAILARLLLSNFIAHPTVLVKRQCFDKVGLFDERMVIASDHDMWLRIAGEFDIGYISAPLIKKRLHEAQVSVKKPVECIKDEFLITEKAITKYPFLKRYESKKKARLYYFWGVILLRQHNLSEARNKAFKAIKEYPFDLICYPLCISPSLWGSFLKKYFKSRNRPGWR